MNFEEFIKLVGVSTPIITLILGYLFNRKINKQKKEAKDLEDARVLAEQKREETRKKEEEERREWLKQFMTNTVDDLTVEVTNIRMLLNHHIEDTDFRAEFRDTIRNRVRQSLVTLSSFLEQDFKNILSNWGDSIEKFGLDWYYNIRKDKSGEKRQRKNVDEYLTQEMEIMIRNFNNYIDFACEEIRHYNKKKLLFSQFIDETKVHNKTEMLKMNLVKNGFKTSEEIFELFGNYIDDFFADFTKILTIWNRQELYERSKENAA